MYQYLKDILDVRLFMLGGTEYTAWIVLYLGILVFVLMFVSRRLKRWLVHNVLARKQFNQAHTPFRFRAQ